MTRFFKSEQRYGSLKYIYIYNCQYTRKKISLLQRKQQSDMSRSSEELTEPNRQRGCESYRK